MKFIETFQILYVLLIPHYLDDRNNKKSLRVNIFILCFILILNFFKKHSHGRLHILTFLFLLGNQNINE